MPIATLSGDFRKPNGMPRTPETFSTTWSYSNPPASNVVGLAGPSERLSESSTVNCILFRP
jgi:hypothetical protein